MTPSFAETDRRVLSAVHQLAAVHAPIDDTAVVAATPFTRLEVVESLRALARGGLIDAVVRSSDGGHDAGSRWEVVDIRPAFA
jgi:hypothetical protein